MLWLIIRPLSGVMLLVCAEDVVYECWLRLLVCWMFNDLFVEMDCYMLDVVV